MISLCKMFSGSRCAQEVCSLKSKIISLEREVASYKKTLETHLGTIQEQKAVFDYQVSTLEREKEEWLAKEKNMEKTVEVLSKDSHEAIVKIHELECELDEAYAKIEDLNSKLAAKIKKKKG